MSALKLIRRVVLGLLILVGLIVASIFVIDAILIRTSKDPAIAKAVEGVSQQNLNQHVRELSAIGSRFIAVKPSSGIRPRKNQSQELAKINQKFRPLGKELRPGNHRQRKLDYLHAQLSQYGYQPQIASWSLASAPYQVRNIFATKLANDPNSPVLDVTAHYDTFPSSPGADDNNSGVAGALEIARLLASRSDIKQSVRFVFFDLEEAGLIGSEAWLNDPKIGLPKASANLNLEMIGYYTNQPDSQFTPVRIPLILDPPRQGNFIIVCGNLNSYRLTKRVEGHFRTYTPDFPYFSFAKYGDLFADASRSDHVHYWQRGIPAVIVGDSANFRNPHYHQPSDTIDTLDFESMTSVVKGVAAFVLDWAN